MNPILYWALAILVAVFYAALAILAGKCCGLNDSKWDQADGSWPPLPKPLPNPPPAPRRNR